MTLEQDFICSLQARFPAVDLRHDTFWDEATRQILTTDLMAEGVHFDWRYFSPQDLGWRAMAANLSDIAATGGTPKWALVNIAIPKNKTIELLNAIYTGITNCLETYGGSIIGGDTTSAEKTFLAITLIATLPETLSPGRRTGAQPGDVIAISGPHGLSKAGLEALQKNLPGFDMAKQAHLRPKPQLALGQKIVAQMQRFAMMDSSDGLADAALRLAQASNVDIILTEGDLKIHPEVQQIAQASGHNALSWVLYGGEDFELVVCLAPDMLANFPELMPIGQVLPASIPGQAQGFLQTSTELIALSFENTFQHFNLEITP